LASYEYPSNEHRVKRGGPHFTRSGFFRQLEAMTAVAARNPMGAQRPEEIATPVDA
jgi:hypothetical protein